MQILIDEDPSKKNIKKKLFYYKTHIIDLLARLKNTYINHTCWSISGAKIILKTRGILSQ